MISEADKEWMKKRLREYYKTQDVEWEYELMEYGINKDTPSNIREYVERELRKNEYDEKLKMLNARISPSLLGRENACDELSKEIEALLVRAENEFPGFKKARGMMISEMYQKIMAYRTEGAVGHTGILKSIHDSKAEKPLKKMKRTATK